MEAGAFTATFFDGGVGFGFELIFLILFLFFYLSKNAISDATSVLMLFVAISIIDPAISIGS